MRIPTHQVHNVLNAYARRLRENGGYGSTGNNGKNPAEEDAHYLFSGKRRAIINKIIGDIIENASRRKSQSQGIEFAAPPAGAHLAEEKEWQTPPQPHRFEYKKIDADNQKISAFIEIPDSDALIRQMEAIIHETPEPE